MSSLQEEAEVKDMSWVLGRWLAPSPSLDHDKGSTYWANV